MKHPMPVYCKS